MQNSIIMNDQNSENHPSYPRSSYCQFIKRATAWSAGALAAMISILTMLACLGACRAAEKAPLVMAGSFVHVYDPSVGEQEKWYINDHCFVHGADGLWHLLGITHQEPA